MEGLIQELIRGIGRLFTQPLLYLAVLTALWIGIRRVRRERNDFHTRIYDTVHDLFFPVTAGLAAGAFLTVAVLGLGIVIPSSIFFLIAAVWVLLLPFRNSRWLSLTFTGSIALIAAQFLPVSGWGNPWIDTQLTSIAEMSAVSMAWLLALLMIAEAGLVLISGPRRTNPLLVKTKRGKTAGSHELNRLWIAPSMFLLPAGGIALTEAGAWPLTADGAAAVGLLLFPAVLGFKVRSGAGYPDEEVKKTGAGLLAVALAAAGLAALALFFPAAALAVPAVLLGGRELVSYFQQKRGKKRQTLFFAREEGLVVLGVIPGLIGDKLGVKIGEQLQRVNGKTVSTQVELYEALQLNSAYCRLEVIDREAQVRFVQSSLYENDHYQLGLIFVPDPDQGTLSNRALRYSLVLQRDRAAISDSPADEHSREAAASKESPKQRKKKPAGRKRPDSPAASH
ncbi:hypothetical protein [Alteribacter natronophilus]|uniref:hypothetical protein n=1 Tax=Alteribacter natronophilus TaxID=2583810 RepID=UPI00110ECA1E|nr:hypothetical protein [Alteribacter natronophilus]TMW72402.1 hypothetical protein FGB90_09370 [Alteribacter natronophilus]